MQFHWKKMWKSSVITCYSLLQHTTWNSYGGSWSFSIGIFFLSSFISPIVCFWDINALHALTEKWDWPIIKRCSLKRNGTSPESTLSHQVAFKFNPASGVFYSLSNKYFVTVAILFCMKILRPASRKLTRSVLHFFFCLTPWIPIIRRRKGLVTRRLFASCFINSFVYSFLGELKGVKIGRLSVVLS